MDCHEYFTLHLSCMFYDDGMQPLRTVQIPPLGQPFVFRHSESTAVGVQGSLIEKMRANSVRIVGGMKLVGDIFIGFSGNPLLLTYSIFSGIGRLIMIGYGTKANQQKVADAAAGKEPQKQGTIGKILHPSEYPVEAAAGSSMIGEAAAGVYGTELIRDHIPADFSKGWAIFLCELLAVYSYGNLLFTKEKKDPAKDKTGNEQSLVFAQSQSKPVGMMGKAKAWMKEHPVIVSSIINIGVGITMMCFATGPAYFVGASILLAANVVQALLVKKREFNVEGALEDRKTAGALPVGAHTARVAEQRAQRDTGEPGMVPA